MGRKQNKHITTIDLFSGCGGLTEGFEEEGSYNTIAAVEWIKPFCTTLIKRLKTKWKISNAEDIVFYFDIQRTSELFKGWENDTIFGSHKGMDTLLNGTKVNLIIGGPPCQAYSVAGRIRDVNGMHNDYRNYLFESYLKVVDHYKPDIFLFENVTGILSAKPGGISIINRIKQAFDVSGYTIIDDIKRYAVFDVADYGIPQFRKRVILIGLNKQKYGDKAFKMLKDLYTNIIPGNKVKIKKTVRDAISDLTPFYPAEKINEKKKISHIPSVSEIFNHYPRYHNKRDVEIFRELAHDISVNSGKYKTIKEIKKLYTEKTGKVSNIHKYFVLRWDSPSNTIVAHLYKDGLRHIHPDYKQARSITVREAARLQTFPDDFEFLGSMGDQYQMIGNAVPVKFAKVLAKSLKQMILKYKML